MSDSTLVQAVQTATQDSAQRKVIHKMLSEMLITLSDKVFIERNFCLDGYRFVNCRFEKCTLSTHRGTFELHHCWLDSATRKFGADALKCVQFYALKEKKTARPGVYTDDLSRWDGFDCDRGKFGMNEEPEGSPRVSVALTGKMLQFNITIGFLLLALVAFLWICSSSENPILCYGGTAMAILAMPGVLFFVVYFYGKQRERPMDGQSAVVSISGKDGQFITVQNPPDRLLDPVEIQAMLRCVVGYDRNVCPDGELLGKASEPEYRQYSEEEKRRFKIEHDEKITGKIAIAEELLAKDEAWDVPAEPFDSQQSSSIKEAAEPVEVDAAAEVSKRGPQPHRFGLDCGSQLD